MSGGSRFAALLTSSAVGRQRERKGHLMLYQSINPATGEVVQTFPTISDSELETAVATADACYRDDWSHRSVADRARITLRAAAILREKADEYARYVVEDMGKLLGVALVEVNL